MEAINVNSKIELEFTLSTSPSILFNRLSTPSGLSEWFAEDVNVKGNVFTFIWDKMEHQAELLSMKENKFIRFRWLRNGIPEDEDSFFEFRITPDDLTGGIALHVTEQIMDGDTDDTKSLWNYQINELKRNLGL
jgi:uncharacterized protein YndB with AHSA1/START domain